MATMAMAGNEMERMHGAATARGGSAAQRNREKFEQQRARRRGPTPEMFFAKHIDNIAHRKGGRPERASAR